MDHVIETSSQKNWEELISLINSTFPVLTQTRFSELNLVKLAELYKTIQTELAWNAKINSDTNTH